MNPATVHPPASRLCLRRPRLFWIGLPLLGVLLIANQAVPRWHRTGSGQAARSVQVAVRLESGVKGHQSIGIDEPATAGQLTFAQLGTWAYEPTAKPLPCPTPITAFHGQQVDLVGFMYPLSPGEQVRTFCLLRSTQTCCFGPKPQFNQYVLVETAAPVRFERMRPVCASGRFLVDPQPQQGYIYRLEQASVTAAGDEHPVIDGRAFAQAHGLAHLDWEVLAGIDTAQPAGPIPPALLAMDGQPTVVDGYLLDPGSKAHPQILVGSAPPPGRPQGRTPTMTTALTICPASGVPPPEAWREKLVWRGTLRLTADRGQWADLGIARLIDALPCREDASAAPADDGPPLTLPWQALLIVAFLVCTIGRASTARTTP